jgi:hypothetical protein
MVHSMYIKAEYHIVCYDLAPCRITRFLDFAHCLVLHTKCNVSKCCCSNSEAQRQRSSYSAGFNRKSNSQSLNSEQQKNCSFYKIQLSRYLHTVSPENGNRYRNHVILCVIHILLPDRYRTIPAYPDYYEKQIKIHMRYIYFQYILKQHFQTRTPTEVKKKYISIHQCILIKKRRMASWSLHFAFLDMLLYINYLRSLSQIIQYCQWFILLTFSQCFSRL